MYPSSDPDESTPKTSLRQMPRATPSPTRTFAELTPGFQELIRLMQRIRFGTIRGLPVRGGEPDLTQPVQIERQIKLGIGSGSGPATPESNFALKSKVVELIAILAGLGDGTVKEIEIRDGLPEIVRLADGPTT